MAELQLGDEFIFAKVQYFVYKVKENSIIVKTDMQTASLQEYGRKCQMWVEKTGNKKISHKL